MCEGRWEVVASLAVVCLLGVQVHARERVSQAARQGVVVWAERRVAEAGTGGSR